MTSETDRDSLGGMCACLADLIRALQHETNGDHWVTLLRDFLDEGGRLTGATDNWPARYSLGRKVESLYGGMGSFNDNCFTADTEQKREALYNLCHDVIREAWQNMGRPTHHVPDAEVFPVGAKVRLIPGAVIYIGKDETPGLAPESPLLYTITQRCPNDVDNMPVYSINSGNHWRIARHEALKRDMEAQPQAAPSPGYRRRRA